MTLFQGCSSCKKDNGEPEKSISSSPIELYFEEPIPEPEPIKKKNSKVKYIEIGSSKRILKDAPKISREKTAEPVDRMVEASLPPKTYQETNLTDRLREKIVDAYGGKEEGIPDIKIYISEMKYNDFVSYYKNLGFNVKTVAVPAMQVIEPVLEQRPELASSINLAEYENVVIHQVMVDEVGISAADKYIDPDTFEIIDKTFVTKSKK